MKKLARFGLAFTLLFSLLTQTVFLPAIHAEENVPRKILTGWIPYYSMKTALPDVLNNADLIKEVMPFWYTLKYNGKTKAPEIIDLYAPANPSVPISEPLNALRNANFEIIPTITDGTSEGVLAGLLKSPTSRTQVVNVIMNLVRMNNYDGIDLDFEGFAFVDKNTTWKATAPLWTAFVKELSVALHAEEKLLSVSTPYVLNPADKQKGYYVYAWDAIASSIDKLRIMTYDYSVAKVGPLGPITWAERTVQYAISIMPASKVFVGVPGYGRDWVTAVSGVCPANVANSVKAGAKAATFVMRDAQSLAATYGATPIYNEQFGEVTFTYQKVYNGTTSGGLATTCTASRTAWYQDNRSWALRAALVTKYRIGGITAWTFGMEEPLAMEAIRTVAKAIAPDQVNAVISVDKNEMSYGTPFTLTGQLSIKDKSPIANLAVRVEGKSVGESTWRTLASAITNAEGNFEKSLILGKSTTIRVYSDPTWERSEGLSVEIPITINRLINLSVPTSAKSGTQFQVAGNVLPRIADAMVTLEKLTGKVWQSIAETVITDAQGNFVITVAPQNRGVYTLRTTVSEDANWAALTSQTFNIIIR
ncbi:Glycoside hydrolase family 18, catalytic domain containing protein [Candidatus Nanopelagicaceae bacterium]